MAVRGNLEQVRSLRRTLAAMPRTLALDVAKKAAPAMTQLGRTAYTGGQTVYGVPRPLGVNGNELDLRASGATFRDLRFESIGTVVRCVLGTPWAKYLIGKYEVLPNGRFPRAWSDRIRQIVSAHKVAP